MKFVLSSLVLILGLLFPAAAFASWDESSTPSDDGTYYELVYTQCAFRYASSSYSENEIECLCGKVADNALKYRGQVPTEKLPPVPDSEMALCLRNRY